jgi:hypothetical protein
MEANQDAMFKLEQDKMGLAQDEQAYKRSVLDSKNAGADDAGKLKAATAAANINAARSLQAYDTGVKTLDNRLKAGEIDISTYDAGKAALTSAVDEQRTSAVRDEGLGGGSGEVASGAFSKMFKGAGFPESASEVKDSAAAQAKMNSFQRAYESSGGEGAAADTLTRVHSDILEMGLDAARHAYINNFNEAALVKRLRLKGDKAEKAIAAEKKKLGGLFDAAAAVDLNDKSLKRLVDKDRITGRSSGGAAGIKSIGDMLNAAKGK